MRSPKLPPSAGGGTGGISTGSGDAPGGSGPGPGAGDITPGSGGGSGGAGDIAPGSGGGSGDNTAPRWLVLGRVLGAHGVRGWVRVQSFTEPQENLLSYTQCHIGRGGDRQPAAIREGRRQGRGLVIHIDGVDDRDRAAALRGSEISVPAQALPALPGDEYYWHQLQGLSVYNAGALLGRVAHLLATGANDVLVVRACPGSIDRRERLVPWVRGAVVESVDLAAGRIDVAWDPEF